VATGGRTKKEAAEAKQRRIEEHQRKKEEKEEQHQRKQKDKEKKKQLAEGHAKKQTSRQRLRDEATASSVCHKLPMQDQLVNEEEEQGTDTLSRPKHHRQLPARFQDPDSEESDDGVFCTICS